MTIAEFLVTLAVRFEDGEEFDAPAHRKWGLLCRDYATIAHLEAALADAVNAETEDAEKEPKPSKGKAAKQVAPVDIDDFETTKKVAKVQVIRTFRRKPL